MAIETSSAAVAAGKSANLLPMISGISWIIAFVLFVVVWLFSVAVGFKIVPLDKRRPHDDAANRLMSGFFSSCTIGSYAAYRFIKHDPEWVQFWAQFFVGMPDQWFFATVAAGLPFIALAALAGFWMVAGWVAFARKNARKYGNYEL